MKSNKQKRAEIKDERFEKNEKKRLQKLEAQIQSGRIVKVDHLKVNAISPMWTEIPDYYTPINFVCCDCGIPDQWTAEQQKWYFEELGKPIEHRPKRCRECRKKERERKEKKKIKNYTKLEKK